jgi:hypothetical protein
MNVKIDDRELSDASPETAKPFVKITVDGQVLTLLDFDSVVQLDEAIDFIRANWRDDA